MKLKGRVALITGAGSGFGREIARLMAQEGAKIAVNDVNVRAIEETLEIIQKTGSEGLSLEADVSNVDQVKAMFEKVVSRWGTIDILVNNAGIVMKPDWKDYEDLHNSSILKAVDEVMKTGKVQESMKITSAFKDEWWHTTININLNGTFYCTREALRVMEKKGKGKIVNIASIAGVQGEPNIPAYSASKGGIVAFTKAVAREVIGSGIMVNAVAPGYCDTPLISTIDPQLLPILKSQIPIGRLGTANEVASLVVYLATDEADYIVGQVIGVNGGMGV
ncbi:MAG: 3-oxoacyl-ACP reductase FabG [Deltaproteobacteria bacterium]|nr:3-oxoacyl-ACP reductase FabG [Deltaproteobacteria bacterium]